MSLVMDPEGGFADYLEKAAGGVSVLGRFRRREPMKEGIDK
jgi:hypothetical protein